MGISPCYLHAVCWFYQVREIEDCYIRQGAPELYSLRRVLKMDILSRFRFKSVHIKDKEIFQLKLGKEEDKSAEGDRKM